MITKANNTITTTAMTCMIVAKGAKIARLGSKSVMPSKAYAARMASKEVGKLI